MNNTNITKEQIEAGVAAFCDRMHQEPNEVVASIVTEIYRDMTRVIVSTNKPHKLPKLPKEDIRYDFSYSAREIPEERHAYSSDIVIEIQRQAYELGRDSLEEELKHVMSLNKSGRK